MRSLFSSASVTARQDLSAALERDIKYERRCNDLIEHILHDDTLGITTEHYTNQDIVVSLTSYGRRIHEVALAIESLMQQTMKANRIVLWLSEDFRDRLLPQALVIQQKRGLEVKFCRDLRSYKKLIPQLHESPDDAIITVDDDLLFDCNVLEHLINAYRQQPDKIHSCRVHRMLFDNTGRLLPYVKWDRCCPIEGTDRRYFITGGGGTLYPPHSLDDEVFNDAVFLDICPNADDVWFTAMAIKKGTPINKVFTRDEYGEDYISIPSPLEQGLAASNLGQERNDAQICAVFSKYALFDKLR